MGELALVDEPSVFLSPAEEAAAKEAGRQATRLILIKGGGGAGEVAAAGAPAAEGAVSSFLAPLLAPIAFLFVLLWPSSIAPDPPMPRAGTKPNPTPDPSTEPKPAVIPEPNTGPVQECKKDKVERERKERCQDHTQRLRNLLDQERTGSRSKTLGLKQRYRELLSGRCGPGQMPFRFDRNTGAYGPKSVWEDHRRAFEVQKNQAIPNALDRLRRDKCQVSDELQREVQEAQKLVTPEPDAWKRDPEKDPCTDTPPPAGYTGDLPDL